MAFSYSKIGNGSTCYPCITPSSFINIGDQLEAYTFMQSKSLWVNLIHSNSSHYLSRENIKLDRDPTNYQSYEENINWFVILQNIKLWFLTWIYILCEAITNGKYRCDAQSNHTNWWEQNVTCVILQSCKRCCNLSSTSLSRERVKKCTHNLCLKTTWSFMLASNSRPRNLP